MIPILLNLELKILNGNHPANLEVDRLTFVLFSTLSEINLYQQARDHTDAGYDQCVNSHMVIDPYNSEGSC